MKKLVSILSLTALSLVVLAAAPMGTVPTTEAPDVTLDDVTPSETLICPQQGEAQLFWAATGEGCVEATCIESCEAEGWSTGVCEGDEGEETCVCKYYA